MAVNQQSQPAMSAQDWSLMLILAAIWGGSFYFIAIAVKVLPPFTIVFLRVAIAAIILQLALPVMGLRFPVSRPVLMAFLGMGLLNNAIPFSLIVFGQKYIARGLTSILNATTPLFTVALTHFLTADEKLTRDKLAGVIIGFIGVVVMIGGAVFDKLGADIYAQLAVLAAAITYGFSGVYGRRFKRLGVPPLATAAGQVSASSLLIFPVMIFIDQPWTLALPGHEIWFAILALAIPCTAIAYILFFRILASAGATNSALVTFLVPLVAIIIGNLQLGEILQTKHYLGMVLISLGLAVMDGRPLRVLTSGR